MTRDEERDEAPLEIDGAAEAMAGLRAAAEETADAVDAAFARAGSSLARSMARAAADGEVSLAELARALIATLNAAFGGKAGGGLLDGLIGAVVGALGGVFGGRREAASTAGAGAGPAEVSQGVSGLVGSAFRLPTAGMAAGALVAPARSSPVSADRPLVKVRGTPGVDWAGLARAMAAPVAREPASAAEPRRSAFQAVDTTPAPQAAAPVVVNVSVAGGAEALLRSEAQIAQTLARAASLGARRL